MCGPVCVFVSGSVWVRVTASLSSSRTSGTGVHISVCRDVCVCVPCAGLSLPARARVSVRPRCVACATCALLCGPSGHVPPSRGGSCAQPRVGTRERALARLQLCTHGHVGEACEPAPAARPSVSRFAFVCSCCRGDAPLGPRPQRSPALRGRAARCGFDQPPRQRRAAPAVPGGDAKPFCHAGPPVPVVTL